MKHGKLYYMTIHLLCYSTLLYFIGLFICFNMVLQYENNKLEESMYTLSASFRGERELFKACESGRLEEYRSIKRKEFFEKLT